MEKTPLSHWIARRLASLTRPVGVCSCWANRRQPPTQWRWGDKGVSYLGVGVQGSLGSLWGTGGEGLQSLRAGRERLGVGAFSLCRFPPPIPPSLGSQVATRWPTRLSPGYRQAEASRSQKIVFRTRGKFHPTSLHPQLRPQIAGSLSFL